MSGGRRPYKIGYAWECLVRKRLEERGYLVFRRHQSAFPDLICIPHRDKPQHVFFVECKKKKYLSKEEKLGAQSLSLHGDFLVAYPERSMVDRRRNDAVLATVDYKEVWRL